VARVPFGAVAIRVVLAEDNVLLREGVARLLAGSDEVELIGATGDLASLLALVDKDLPDVVVTDIRMPPTHTDEGIRAATELRERHPTVGVVVLSSFSEPAYALALLGEGSAGRAYLLKERVSEFEELVRAIREVAAGRSVIDPVVVEALVASGRRRSSELDRLTQREREVLAEMATGKNNSAIAGRLVLSERAIEKHSNSIFSKLGLAEEPDVNRRVKAVLLFLAEQGK
jgi:DNA-binding NarL/FixJ family response regulator